MSRLLDVYLIPTRRGRYVLYSHPEIVEALDAESGQRIRQFIGWFMRHSSRFVAWVGRVLNAGYGYYLKLEDRIDPQERVLKAMDSAERFLIHFIRIENGGSIGTEFQRLLKRQRRKHTFWFSIDIVTCGVVLVFTPVLAPIPGPNVILYYPFLRLLSHYRAMRGAASGLRYEGLEFKSLPGLSGLEDNPALIRFLERMDP